MVGRGEDTLESACYWHEYFQFWTIDGVVRPFPRHFGPLQRGQTSTLSTFYFIFAYPASVVERHVTYTASALSAASVSPLLVVFHPMTVCAERTINCRVQVTRCLFALAFPLFGTQMFDALGLGVGNSLLAAVGIAVPDIYLVPIENDSGHGAA